MENEREWSRDWENFDWDAVMEKLQGLGMERVRAEKLDIGITKEEFIEYYSWLCHADPEKYVKTLMYHALRNMGMEHDAADYFSSNPEELEKFLKAAGSFTLSWV